MNPSAPLALDLVLSGRDLTEPKISPDADLLAYVERWRGASAIVVADLAAVADSGAHVGRPVTFGSDPAPGRGMSGGCFSWRSTGNGLVYAAVDGELWSVAGSDTERLTEHGRACRGPACQSVDDAELVAYVVDEAEVWLMELRSGDSRRIDEGRHDFCFDPAISPDGSTVSWQGWSPPAMAWDAAERVDCLLATNEVRAWRPAHGAVQQPRFAPDGTPTCIHDATGWLNVYRDGVAVAAESFEQGGPTWGMGQRSYDVRRDGSVVLIRNDDALGKLCLVDAVGVREIGGDFIGTYGHVSVVGGRLAALRSGPSTPPEVVVFSLATNIDEVGQIETSARLVATGGVRGWVDVEVTAPQPLVVDHAGVSLHARRYVASGSGPSAGRMLCWVHGGPTDQWRVDFRPRLAYWLSRGWDILVVDPRGTTGHGRDYQQELNGQWGRLDVDDVAALLRHAHHQGWATPDTTVGIGGSSGGLTVLGLLADHPGLIAGGVASYPVSDLLALAHSSHRFEAHYTDTLVGPVDDLERFQRLSPINRVDQIERPLLLFHGSDDPVVALSQSELLVERMRVAGRIVEYVTYEGEGHGFRDPVNQRDEYARTAKFLNAVTTTAATSTTGPA